MAPIEKSSMMVPDAKQIKEELVLAANTLRHSCRLGIARIEAPEKKIANIPAAQRAELTKELDALIVESKRLWLVRNRPGGLKDSIAHLERLRESYQDKAPQTDTPPAK
jgi:hexosaminidase